MLLQAGTSTAAFFQTVIASKLPLVLLSVAEATLTLLPASQNCTGNASNALTSSLPADANISKSKSARLQTHARGLPVKTPYRSLIVICN